MIRALLFTGLEWTDRHPNLMLACAALSIALGLAVV